MLCIKFSAVRRQVQNRKSTVDSRHQRIERHAALAAEVHDNEALFDNLEAALRQAKQEQATWRSKLEEITRLHKSNGDRVHQEQVEALMPQLVRLFAT